MKKIKEIWNRFRALFRKGKADKAAPAAAEPAAQGEEQPQEKKKKKIPFWVRRSVFAVFLTGFLTGLFVFMTFIWYAFFYLDDEFDLSTADTSLNYTSKVMALKDGAYVEAETLHTVENRIPVDIEDVPLNLQRAFVAIEDKRFYEHSGVDIKRTLSAILNFVNPSSGSTFGGSTITQQVIKNISGDDEQTVSRKIQEIRRAWYLEREYKKDQILEVYLNTIYLSQGCYGVATAANTYFGKSLDQLTLLECASLASITKLPTYYDPVVNPENNLERAHLVLDEMRKAGWITEEEAEEAKSQELELHLHQGVTSESGDEINSYFVDQVINDVIDALVNEKGYSETYARKLVFSGGIQIFSTMDLKVQDAVDQVYKNRDNFPNITSKGKGVAGQKPQSAIAVIDNSTGAIVGMAGGIGEKTTARGLNRATQSFLQPGSCMKPIGTYGPAIELGATIDGVRVAPGMLLMDQAVRPVNGNPWPKNYDGYSNKLMTVQAALDQSKNTVAVRVNDALGARTAFNFLKNNLGVNTLVAGTGYDENAQAMALGGLHKGISVAQITASYSAFANEGTYTKPYTFTRVLDRNGRVILEHHVESNTAMKANTAAVINQMLQHAATYGTGSVARFDRNYAICGKTGTTNGDKDRWFVGYTKYYTAAVWFGYDQPAEVKWGGSNPAAMAWKNVMGRVHSGLPSKSFTPATGLATFTVCGETGKLVSEACGNPIDGQFFVDKPPTEVCDACGAPPEEEPGVDPPGEEDPKPDPPGEEDPTPAPPPEEIPTPAPPPDDPPGDEDGDPSDGGDTGGDAVSN